MISSQIIQSSLEELSAITRTDLAVWDLTGTVVASTFDCSEIESRIITEFGNSPADSQVVGPNHFLKVMDEEELLYVLDAKGL